MNPGSHALGSAVIGKIILQHRKMDFVGQGNLLSKSLKHG